MKINENIFLGKNLEKSIKNNVGGAHGKVT
jgi:hypothetical protein